MVIWDPSEVAFSLGSFDVRWYGLCWCIGLAMAYLVVMKLYQRQQIPPEKFESLFLYCFVGILVGARLGHCLFYEPGYFLSHPIEMVLPLRETPDGAWRFTGFEVRRNKPLAACCSSRVSNCTLRALLPWSRASR